VLEAECPNAFLAAWRPEWRPCNLVLWSKLGRRLGFLLGEQYPELVRKVRMRRHGGAPRLHVLPCGQLCMR